MKGRSAPETGYDFGNKRQYRRNIWKLFREARRHRLDDDPEVLGAVLLPSIEGEEIEIALTSGWKERQLHVVDRNPAIVATLKRRFPGIHTYGVELARAAKRIPPNSISVANLDLCSQLSTPWIEQVSGFVLSGCLRIPSWVATTALVGREAPEYFELVKWAEEEIPTPAWGGDLLEHTPMNRGRLRMMSFALFGHPLDGGLPESHPLATLRSYHVKSGIYRSGRQRMIWVINRLAHDFKRRNEIRRALYALEDGQGN